MPGPVHCHAARDALDAFASSTVPPFGARFGGLQLSLPGLLLPAGFGTAYLDAQDFSITN
jgi:hypothetical protein